MTVSYYPSLYRKTDVPLFHSKLCWSRSLIELKKIHTGKQEMSFSDAEEVILSKSQISKQTFFKIHNLPFHRHSNRHVFSYLEKADNPINMREKNLNFKSHLSLLKPASIQLPCIKENIYTCTISQSLDELLNYWQLCFNGIHNIVLVHITCIYQYNKTLKEIIEYLRT